MLNEYLYEIIILIVVLTLIVIYFLTRKFNQEEENSFEDIDYKKVTPIDDPYEDIIPLEEETKQEIEDVPFKFENQEEGIFGSIQDNPFDENDTKPITAPLNLRQKIDVPEHEKITKENFKDFKGVKLLVAEDNVINQKVIMGLLSESGIEITIAEDGQVVLDILEKDSNFDMILMDVHMPRVDGFQATKIIRENPKYEHIVIVALSGDVATDDIRRMTEAGMEEHLEKPLRMEDFYDILYAYTKSKNDKKEKTLVEVIVTQELNGDKGLAVCGGDEDFYKDILSEFINTYTNVSHKLKEQLKEKNMKDADALLLDFIGITANIGADTIKNIAVELKAAIKNMDEQSYLAILDNFEIHLSKLLKDIEEYS